MLKIEKDFLVKSAICIIDIHAAFHTVENV